MQYSIGDIRRLLFISVLAIFFHIIVLVHLNFLLFLVFNVAFDNEEKKKHDLPIQSVFSILELFLRFTAITCV